MLIHVVSHTHWDREWYHTAERFRQRLVPLIDELLDDASRGSFLLDGQTVVLEDYLDVRPERASELSTALRGGRLEAGPWFVLADELIPGGEGLVRNLLAGARTMRDLRAESPPVLYCPDSFGHPASLPDIAAGFGKKLIVVWRGCRSAVDAFYWRGREAWVLTYHLSRSGYELGANLPAEPDAAAVRWKRIRAEIADRGVTGESLLLNGADHHARQRNLGAAIDALRAAAKSDEVQPATMTEFAHALEQRASAMRLAESKGEMRDSYGYTWTLQGTLASRAHQKRRYAGIERELVRDVEPWVALARLAADASRRPLMRAAWRDVLLCQPHDSLCGCSTDAVARAVDGRLESAESQAAGLREYALLDLAGHDRDEARSSPSAHVPVLLVRNPSARRRSGVALVDVVTKIADAPVGPGSKPPRASRKSAKGLAPTGAPTQLLSETLEFARTEAPRAYPDNDIVLRQRAAVWLDAVHAYGTTALPLTVPARKSPVVADPVRVAGKHIANATLSLTWNGKGEITMEQLASRRTLRGLVSWDSREDVGDLYTPAIRKPKLKSRLVSTRVGHRGPLRATVEQRWQLTRGKERVDLTITFVIDAGARFVRVSVAGDNRATDHRLRIVFATDVAGDTCVADAAFGPVERQAPQVPVAAVRLEKAIATAPLHRYVSRFDASRGITLYSDGLAEYERLRRGIAVTLVRSVGELSRANLRERPGHAGWPVPTPDAQCQGAFAAEFAVFMHGARSDDVSDEIERTADDVLHPLTGDTLRSALTVPKPARGFELDGVGLAFSTAKESEQDAWIVLRCVNLLDRATTGRWRLPRPAREAMLARLDETPFKSLKCDGDAVPFQAPPRGTVTILIR